MLIIDYDVGNIGNVRKIIESFGQDVLVSNSERDVNRASSYILPGVGAFPDAMRKLAELGLIETLKNNVCDKKKPILGICLGMQILGLNGDEGGNIDGLGILNMSIRRLQVTTPHRLPHIGWNNIKAAKNSMLLAGLPEAPDFYFVHSYHAQCHDDSIVAATCDYGGQFVAAVEHQNVFGVQFHPEKSQAYGAKVLQNFVSICSRARR